MLAFLDESGDPGRKILSGSSVYFVIALVTFNDNDDALAYDQRIGLLRVELGLPPHYEFHFSDNPRSIRESFLQAVAPYHFFYHIFALNKDPEKLYGPGFDVKESLYKFATRLIFENAKPYLVDAKVIIDGSGERNFRNEVRVYLRRRVRDEQGRKIIRSVSIQNSRGNNLLQLADYVASTNNRAIHKKSDGVALHRKYLAPHQITLQIWPK